MSDCTDWVVLVLILIMKRNVMSGNLLTWIVPVMCVLGVQVSLILIMDYLTVRELLLPFLMGEEYHNVMTDLTKKKHLLL